MKEERRLEYTRGRGLGVLWSIAHWILAKLSPLKGCSRAARLYSRHPKAQTSTLQSKACLCTCSGE